MSHALASLAGVEKKLELIKFFHFDLPRSTFRIWLHSDNIP